MLRPDREPRATGHVSEIVAMVETLIDKGYAYPAANGREEEWLAQRLRFHPGLPARPPMEREEEPHSLVGARLMRFGGEQVAYVLYRLEGKPISLLMTSSTGRVRHSGEVFRSGKLDFSAREQNVLLRISDLILDNVAFR